MQLTSRLRFRAAALVSASIVGCGARSEPEQLPFEQPIECSENAQCSGDACLSAACVAGLCEFTARSCDDGDPCTEDACDPAAGCRHRGLAVDRDGDGHFSPRLGYLAGEPDSCGDDCDDTSGVAHPEAPEVCDGRDNDCNGVIDEGARYEAGSSEAVRLSSPAAERAGHGGLLGLEHGFVLNLRERHSAEATRWQTRLLGLEPNGDERFSTPVSLPNVPVEYGPLVWSGEELVTVWEDDRAGGSYDIYLARFNALGEKLGPDVRVTESQGFSLNPSLAFNHSEYVLVWDDRREERQGEGSRLYGQRISLGGELLGQNVLVTPDEQGLEFPDVTVGKRRLGLVYAVFGNPNNVLRFRTLSADLEPFASSDTFGEEVRNPSVDPLDGAFAVIWETYFPSGPGNELWGAVFDEEAKPVISPTLLASGARFLRGHSVLSFGDRLLVVWADDTDGNYDLFWQFFGPDLSSLGPRVALTRNAADSFAPALAVAEDGSVGVAFDDYRDGSRQVYFTTLACR